MKVENWQFTGWRQFGESNYRRGKGGEPRFRLQFASRIDEPPQFNPPPVVTTNTRPGVKP